MANYRVISSDSHVIEPPDLWTSRLEPKYRDRAPHIVREGVDDWWYCDEQKLCNLIVGTQAGLRFEAGGNMVPKDAYWENVPPGGYIPEEQVKDMEADGVDSGIIYPSVGLALYRNVPDSELLSAIFGSYNDWLAEFCKPFPNRLKGVAMINVDDVGSAIKELQRCANMGLGTAMISVAPPWERGYYLPDYEPLWAAAQDLDMPLSLHLATNRPGSAEGIAGDVSTAHIFLAFVANADHWVRMCLFHLIFRGVFERFPKLRVGAVETELGWVPHFLNQLDYAYTQRPRRTNWFDFKNDVLPSEFFHRNVFLSFQEDSLGIRLRDIIGVDNLQWGSDYPHVEGTFPRSRQILEEILAECTEEEKAKIAGGNAERVYHF